MREFWADDTKTDGPLQDTKFPTLAARRKHVESGAFTGISGMLQRLRLMGVQAYSCALGRSDALLLRGRGADEAALDLSLSRPPLETVKTCGSGT